MWMDLETVIQSEVSQKGKNKYRILMHICGINAYIWSVFIPIPKKSIAKECSNYCAVALISHTLSKVMLRILQARLHQYVN